MANMMSHALSSGEFFFQESIQNLLTAGNKKPSRKGGTARKHKGRPRRPKDGKMPGVPLPYECITNIRFEGYNSQPFGAPSGYKMNLPLLYKAGKECQ